MNIKLKFTNKDKELIEATFKFKGIDNQFHAMQIFMSANKKFPNFFNKNENVNKNENDFNNIDFDNIEASLYCGEIIMKKCIGYEYNGQFIECDDFKTKEGVEEFFKYSLIEYISMISQLMGFISTSFQKKIR